MSLNIAVALLVGCVLGVCATVTLIGLAFAVKDRKDGKNERMDR